MATPSAGPSAVTTTASTVTAPAAKGALTKRERALDGIRAFLESKSCYDILPESFRLIVFDNKLGITRSLQALVTNGVVSAPLYDSTTQRFAGMFTLADVVHLIQYYYLTSHEYENVVAEVEAFQLESLRKIEQAIDVPPPPTIFVHPDQPLADACAALVRTHARRLPLVDRDDQTGKETIVSVLTQYRVLKFIAINCQHDCARLDQSIGSLGIGSYVSGYDSGAPTPTSPISPLSPLPDQLSPLVPLAPSASSSAPSTPADSPAPTTNPSPSATPAPTPSSPPAARAAARSRARSISKTLDDAASQTPFMPDERYFPLATATLKTSVFDVVHIFSERGISAVPIVDEDGIVLNMYETVDVVDLVRQNAYQVLDKTIEVALQQRASDFGGVITCTPQDTLASILAYIRERRCHRFVIVEGEGGKRKKGSLVGILSLSDVLRYMVGHENLKGHEVEGLGVHGLRGVGKSDGVHTTSVLSDALRDGLASKAGSRRGSETTDAGSIDGVEIGQPQPVAEGSALEDVIEGKVA
ncbi:hypothetical protein T439DRAFT_310611 [Meredithblackwellia eburnea MCA 4105]